VVVGFEKQDLLAILLGAPKILERARKRGLWSGQRSLAFFSLINKRENASSSKRVRSIKSINQPGNFPLIYSL
jgi:hypothetical protein